ncbi:unnamed protein product, partial [Tetraodon nigroviridis]
RDVQSIISDYFTDQDPRVRTAALKAMLQLHDGGVKIHEIIYEQACRLLWDDYQQVRSAAVRMVWVLSQLYPESIVPIPSSNEEIRLVDDAFGKISHMVSDGSWMVRVQAAKTLRKRTAHERAKDLFASGEFSSGRKWADDAPKEKLDTNTVNLIASGACGAFVHGLEDEMFGKLVPPTRLGGLSRRGRVRVCPEVRIAAVEALCELARSSPSFAEKCLDFLVDMFNDEIEEVRLQSIHALREISTHITLREDQLDTVLAVLEVGRGPEAGPRLSLTLCGPQDSSRDIREALHELICYTNVSTKECVQLALLELLKNLSKYPTDRSSVWKCLKFLGSRHPTLVLPLVPELLNTHPYFDTPEPDMDDPAYMAVLVLVFNAARWCPTMPALFSDHTFRHYAYLRDSLSHLVPPLRLPGSGLDLEDSRGAWASVESPQLFLQQSLSRVSTIQNLEAPGAQELLDLTIRDLRRLGELQTELEGSADFCATYLGCQLLLMKALQEKLWNMAVPLCYKQHVTATAAAQQVCTHTHTHTRTPDATAVPWLWAGPPPVCVCVCVCVQILEETYKLEFLYSGLKQRHVASVHHVRLQARALQLVMRARSRPGLESLTSSCEAFVQDLASFQRLFALELPQLQDGFAEELLRAMPRLSCCSPLELVTVLQATLRQSSLLPLAPPEQVQRASAAILEPTGESDNPLRFTSGLVLALDVDATLEHVQEPQNCVKVQVLYPDGQSHVIHPKPGDFRRPGPGRHRLITQVYLSHTSWTAGMGRQPRRAPDTRGHGGGNHPPQQARQGLHHAQTRRGLARPCPGLHLQRARRLQCARRL